MYKQLIIARKDLNMSAGKLAVQVAHGSMAFLTSLIKNDKLVYPVTKGQLRKFGSPPMEDDKEVIGYDFEYIFDRGLYEQWIQGSFTKVLCEAKNKNQLLKAKTIAEQMGYKEGEDFFLIRDNCLTELEPEEIDADGVGRTLTVIGFRPMHEIEMQHISKKFQLYKG